MTQIYIDVDRRIDEMSRSELTKLINHCYKSKRRKNILYDRFLEGFTYEALFLKYTKNAETFSDNAKAAEICRYKKLITRFKDKINGIL